MSEENQEDIRENESYETDDEDVVPSSFECTYHMSQIHVINAHI